MSQDNKKLTIHEAEESAKEAAKISPAGKIIIEISENDQIMTLIEENTYKTGRYKKTESILKCLAMIASGTKKHVACRTTGLPYQTYVKWLHKEWYHECMELIKIEFDNQLDASLTSTTHTAISELNDRMENGDVVLDKEGNEQRKKMSGRDLGVTFATIFDRRQLLRNKPTSVSERKSTSEVLDSIAERFEDLAVIDADFTEESSDADFTITEEEGS